MDPKILKEEQNYLVVDKPASLIVHSDGKTNEKSLCDFLIEKYPEIKGVGEPLKLSSGDTIDRPGIVHRLDRETSGVMLVARNSEGFEFLKNLFKNREVQKTYHAFVYGNIREDHLIIDEPIGRSKKDFRQWLSGKNARGNLRSAVTEIKVLKRSEKKNITFIEACPKTGRTHQIRVHLKSINNPIVADSLYAPDREQYLGFERMALHSYKISFVNEKRDTVEYVAPYSNDFKAAIAIFS